MFSTDGILGRNFAVTSAALDGLALRQQVHAQNLANINTEGYTAKTVDFESALKGAMDGDSPGVRFNDPLAGSGAGAARDGAALSAGFRVTNQNGNKGVDRVKEVSDMANDNVRFRVLSQSVTNDLSAIRSVIAEMGRG